MLLCYHDSFIPQATEHSPVNVHLYSVSWYKYAIEFYHIFCIHILILGTLSSPRPHPVMFVIYDMSYDSSVNEYNCRSNILCININSLALLYAKAFGNIGCLAVPLQNVSDKWPETTEYLFIHHTWQIMYCYKAKPNRALVIVIKMVPGTKYSLNKTPQIIALFAFMAAHITVSWLEIHWTALQCSVSIYVYKYIWKISCVVISIRTIIRSWDRLIFIMGVPMIRQIFILKQPPECEWSAAWLNMYLS